MLRKTALLLPSLMLLLTSLGFGQQDLMNMLGNDDSTKRELVQATFKTTRLGSGQSIENPANGVLMFMLSHRFGPINQGAYEYFGLDQSTIRLGFEYGVNDRLAVGFGRSGFRKTFDGFVKFKLLRQSTGKRSFPFTLSYFGDMTLNSLKWANPERTNHFTDRLAFAHQLLIARKFSNAVSLQLMPTLVHRNLVATPSDHNDIFAMGGGGRVKLTNRMAVNFEYYYLLPGQHLGDAVNSMTLGFDIETGGHVFQLLFTNSLPQFETAFIPETTEKWNKGGIHFGFNLTRVFTVKQTADLY